MIQHDHSNRCETRHNADDDCDCIVNIEDTFDTSLSIMWDHAAKIEDPILIRFVDLAQAALRSSDPYVVEAARATVASTLAVIVKQYQRGI